MVKKFDVIVIGAGSGLNISDAIASSGNKVRKVMIRWKVVLVMLILVSLFVIAGCGRRGDRVQQPPPGEIGNDGLGSNYPAHEISGQPFGLHAAVTEKGPNDLSADTRIIIRGSSIITMGASAKSEAIKKSDSLIQRLQTKAVITIVSGAEDPATSSFKYCLLEGDELQEWIDFVKLAVERYDGDSNYGCTEQAPDCYAPGDTAYPSEQLKQAIQRNPVEYWQIENEWQWQVQDCSSGEPMHLSIEKRVSHLKTFSENIKSANPNAKIILGAITGSTPVVAIDGYYDDQRYIEVGGNDCNYQKISIATAPKEAENFRVWREDTIGTLVQGKNYYDIIDLHLYEAKAEDIARNIQWLKDQLAKNKITGKKIWSLESASPYFFFTLMGEAKPTTCTQGKGTDSGPGHYKVSGPYSDKILSESLVKHYVIGINTGLDKIFWSSYYPTFGWSDNFLRLSLIDEYTYREKPAYYTYKLLAQKIQGAIRIRELGKTVYGFEYADGRRIVVAWDDSDGQTRDLSTYLGSSQVKITHIITEPGKTEKDAAVENVPANAVKMDRTPIFVEKI